MPDPPPQDRLLPADASAEPVGGPFPLQKHRLVLALALIAGLSLVLHGALWLSQAAGNVPGLPGQEVTLGEFFVEPDPAEETDIRRADFRLHISLLSEMEQPTHERLAARRFRVQQNVEELLRQAHGGDFLDPRLTELKRQLQEKINETLALRGVHEVIITDLTLQMKPASPTLPASLETHDTSADYAPNARFTPAPRS